MERLVEPARFTRPGVLLFLLALLATACSSGKGNPAAPSSTSSPAPAPTLTRQQAEALVQQVNQEVNAAIANALAAGLGSGDTGGPPSGGCTTAPIRIGTTVQGTLATTDCVAPHRSSQGARADLYTFGGQSGQVVTIAMSSDAFDTYLILISPDGSVLAENDDSGGSLNSRIQMRLPSSGTYTIEATAFSSSDLGAYRVETDTTDLLRPAGDSTSTVVKLPRGVSSLIYAPISFRQTCAAGGRMELSGSISGNDPVGDVFAVTGQLNVTITDWQCVAGIIVNGDPYLTSTGSVRFTGDTVSLDFRDGGGFKWIPTGGGAGGSCQQNITTSASGSISGLTLSGFQSGQITCQPGNVVIEVNNRF